jgi:hypothetical protein
MASSNEDDNTNVVEVQLRQQFLQLNQANMRGDQHEATLEGLKALFEASTTTEHSRISISCALAISLNYSSQRDWTPCIQWAKTALNQAEELGDYTAASDAAKGLAINMRDEIKTTTIQLKKSLRSS